MLLTSNTTILTIPNGTTQGQHNPSCIYVDSTAVKISKLCGYSVILLGSFFGNIFIIIIVYKHRELRKTVNYFIVNMAVSDLLSSLIVIPFLITGLVTDSWHWRVNGILGSILCKLFHFVGSVSLLVSSQSLVWIAIDRFVAIVFPIKIGLISTKIRAAAILSTWIVAVLFNFPLLIYFGLVVQRNKTYCAVSNAELLFSNQESIAAYGWLQSIFFSIAPIFFVTILYTAIAISLKRQSKALADTTPNVQRDHCLKKRRQAIQMAVVVVVLFYICVIPFICLHFLLLWSTSCALAKIFNNLAMFMFYSSSTVNPVIYLSFVESYRRGLRNILCSCKRNGEMAKRQEMTIPKIKCLPQENCNRTFKETEDDGETLDTVL